MCDETHDAPEVIEGEYDAPEVIEGECVDDVSPFDALGLPDSIREDICIALFKIEVHGVGSCTPAPVAAEAALARA